MSEKHDLARRIDSHVESITDNLDGLCYELNKLEAENARLQAGCNPECPECGHKPCNEHGAAVLWCDECASGLKEENERLRVELKNLQDRKFGELQRLRAEVERLKRLPTSLGCDTGM